MPNIKADKAAIESFALAVIQKKSGNDLFTRKVSPPPPLPPHIIVGSVRAGVEPSHVFLLPSLPPFLPFSLPPPCLRVHRSSDSDCDDDLSCLALMLTTHFPEVVKMSVCEFVKAT